MIESALGHWSVVVTSEVDHELQVEGDGLRSVLDRVTEHVPVDRVILACSGTRVAALAREVPEVPEQNFVVAPEPRGSAALVALATGLVLRLDANARLVIVPEMLPRGNVSRWLKDAFTLGVATAAEATMVVVGSQELTDARAASLYGVVAHEDFHIKSSAPSVFAMKHVANGYNTEESVSGPNRPRTLTSTGIVIWRGAALMDRLPRVRPDLAAVMRATGEEWQRYDYERVTAMQWALLSDASETLWSGLLQPLTNESVVISSD